MECQPALPILEMLIHWLVLLLNLWHFYQHGYSLLMAYCYQDMIHF